MDRIIFENVRCFHTRQSCPVKPITLLVGENSSGKSTFLALTRIAWDIARGDITEDFFNEEPFLLGAYDQVASYRGGKAGRAKSFTIGSQFPLDSQISKSRFFSNEATITAQFISQGVQPKLDQWEFASGNFKFTVQLKQGNKWQKILLSTPEGSQEVGGEVPPYQSLRINPSLLLRDLWFLVSPRFPRTPKEADRQHHVLPESELQHLQQALVKMSRTFGERPYASAPIRTRPQRTYDPLKDVPKPEGSHVPMVLAKTFTSDPKAWGELRQALIQFGKESGLFTDVEIKRKGHKESDPFQIAVRTFGPAFNLVDVGYGVSQVLPILVDSIQEEEGRSFLLQQPEVHLHPKAQAALGSFLAALAKKQRKRFVIETHSDYLLDRIRMDIRDHKFLTPDDVAILYFERTKEGVTISSLGIDEFGNIVNAPPTYRQFFLDEERRLFSLQ
jgi:predicted ATPase